MVEFVKNHSSCVKDKVFMVTGGAAGVGAGIVRMLLSENASHVAFLDIKEREGTALESELILKFGALRAKFIKCDISDDVQLEAAFKLVLEKYHRLDGVINNAAVVATDEQNYRKMINVNFYASVNSTMKALEKMGTNKGGKGGVIVNMSSLLALNLGTHLPVYAATKTAVLQFSMAMGTDEVYSNTGVRVITVCLGPTDTAILHRSSSYELSTHVTSRVSERQRVQSAVHGVLEVMEKGRSGSTWVVEQNLPAFEYTDKLTQAFAVLSRT